MFPDLEAGKEYTFAQGKEFLEFSIHRTGRTPIARHFLKEWAHRRNEVMGISPKNPLIEWRKSMELSNPMGDKRVKPAFHRRCALDVPGVIYLHTP